MGRHAAIYARQSLDRSGEGLAVGRQLEDCRRLAESRKWTVVDQFVDNDVSASSGRRRPQYQRLLDSVRAGQVDAIVTWSADRLSRRPIEIEQLIDLVEEHAVGLAMVSGDIDLGTPYGRAVARIFGAIARQEVEQKGARQARANLQRAKAGRVAWSRRPFGYDLDSRGQVVVVPGEADELRKAATAVLNGASLASVVRDFTERGVVTAEGGAFSVTALRRLLLNPRHAGLASYRGELVGEGDWQPVLDATTHEQLVVKLSDPSRRTATTTSHRYLLSGLAKCGLCGDGLFGTPMGKGEKRRTIYRCPRMHLGRKVEYVDEVVVGVLLARLSQPDAAQLLVAEPNLDELRQQATALRARRDEATALHAEGLITAAGLRDSLERIRRQLVDLEGKLASSSGGNAAARLVTAVDVETVWAGLSLHQRRGTVATLIEVTVLPAPHRGARFTPDQVSIEWKD